MIEIGTDFSGIGAFEQALIRLSIDYKTVFACDMDKYARQTYIANYGEPQYFPYDVYDRIIPKKALDIYMTSPPCQGFSIAGKRGGSILFLNSHQFIQQNKPRYFIFENVKGLLSHEKKNKDDTYGNTFNQWLNYLGGKSVNGNPIIFPHEDSDWSKRFDPHDENDVSKCLTARYFKMGKTDPYLKVKSATKKGFEVASEGDSINLSQPNSETRRGRIGKKVAQTLDTACNQGVMIGAIRGRNPEQPTSREPVLPTKQMLEINKTGNSNALTTVQKDNVVVENYKIRRLTPLECFRLMDFNNDFKWDVSDTQAYKQAGNSIVVACLVGILDKLL